MMQEHEFNGLSVAETDVLGKIFVGGLSWSTSVTTLRNHFEQFGECVDVALMIDKRNGKPRGFAFVKMKNASDADRVMNCPHVIDGRRVDIKRALPRDRAPGPIRGESFKLFIGGLPPSVGSTELDAYFSQFGSIKEAVVMIDRVTGNSRGFGFVTYHTEEPFQYVLTQEHVLMNKRVEIRRAEARNHMVSTENRIISQNNELSSHTISATSASNFGSYCAFPDVNASHPHILAGVETEPARSYHHANGQYATIRQPSYQQGVPNHFSERLTPNYSLDQSIVQRQQMAAMTTPIPCNHSNINHMNHSSAPMLTGTSQGGVVPSAPIAATPVLLPRTVHSAAAGFAYPSSVSSNGPFALPPPATRPTTGYQIEGPFAPALPTYSSSLSVGTSAAPHMNYGTEQRRAFVATALQYQQQLHQNQQQPQHLSGGSTSSTKHWPDDNAPQGK